MKVIKKINNNVAIGLDGNGNEIILMGKGVGFPQTPYELKDMSVIDRTFYDIDSKYYGLLKEIPEEIFMMVSRLLDQIKSHIKEDLKPNLVFVLADHINFAIVRYHQGIDAGLPYSYEMEYEYPELTKLAAWFVDQVNRQMNIKLNQGEITSVTVHLLNSMEVRERKKRAAADPVQTEELIDAITAIIEKHFQTRINKESFYYFRFKNHMKFFVQRRKKGSETPANSNEIYLKLRQNYPEVSACVDKIDDYLAEKFGEKCPQEELMYLMIHVFQLYSKDISGDNGNLDNR